MEQFRQVGEVLGGLKALMVLQHDISINPRQCRLLFDILDSAFDTISDEIRHNLKLSDHRGPHNKWKALDLPMKELHRVFKEADLYIRHCSDFKDWWGRAISLHMSRDCVESHIHNLLSCFPVVIEAIESASEASGLDQDDMQRRRVAIMQKYDPELDDFRHFAWKHGRQYLVSREISSRMETAWNEDRWMLLERIREKKTKLGEVMIRKMNENMKLSPSNVLVGAGDYFVRRRLGSGYPSGGGHLKEIHWLGENLALRTFYGEISEAMESDISLVLSLSHPNVLQYLFAFYDEDRKEGFLVMELMSKDLSSHIKEHSGQKNRIPFTIPVAVDIMLQIARGMEYLHSKKIYLGDLNPSHILLKPKSASVGGFQAKVAGFGMDSIKSASSTRGTPKPNSPADLNIWLAPEVLAGSKNGEKADVYSFGMLCFELLTGKVPFEDGHLQGEKMVRNILAGERPLFSYPFPKYLQNLTRKCWQTNPNQRPAFSSVCRILRYIKKNLVINPNHGDPESPPLLVDYCDMEAGYLKRFPGESGPVSQIPFQMFTYTVFEKQKLCGKKSELTNTFGDEHLAAMDDLFLVTSDRRSFCSEIIETGNSAIGVDTRSVISESSHWKLHQLDHQQSFGSLIPERKNGSITTQDVEKVKTADKLAECQLAASPRTQEHVKSVAATKVPEQKLDKSQILEMKHKQSSSSEPSEGNKSLTRVLSSRLPDIPEKKILHDQKNVSTHSPSTSQKNADKKTEDSGKSAKKSAFLRRLKEIKIKRSPESPKNNSSKSEPAKTKKTKPIFSPASSPSRNFMPSPSRSFMPSPSRAFKKSATPESPRSPAWTPKKTGLGVNSPTSSPSRIFHTCSLPLHSKESLSPLHPSCTRSSTSRLGRQTSLK